jgi:hypothetical protein
MNDVAPRHSSESAEHFTPGYIVEAARATLGVIDLDPASCEETQRAVRAVCWFGEEQDGFTWPWYGRTFVNPPGGMSDNRQRRVIKKCHETGACGLPPGHKHEGVESSQKKWWYKLAREFIEGRAEAAIFVCFSVELLQSTQKNPPPGLPLPLAFPICYPASRVAYVKPGGEIGAQPPHASCIVCVANNGSGPYISRFDEAFSPIGRVVIPSRGPGT